MSTARRIRTLLLALLLGVLGQIALAPPASACSCVHAAADPVLFDRAAVVFVGTVADDRSRGGTRTLTFTVERVFKGAATSQQQVRTHVQPATCGLVLEGRGPFLVQAADSARGLVADLCGGTRATVRTAGADGGYPPLPGGGPPSGRSTPGTVAVLVVVTLAGLALVAVLQRRSGRAER
ncbi:hypothetical protein GCM10009616_17360 [Microlunatus lacustris]